MHSSRFWTAPSVPLKDYLDLTLKRYHGGVATESDVALAQTQLATTQTQDTDIAVARAQYEHAIATLLGVSASSFALPSIPQNENLPTIPAGVPSALLQRRPDIAASERRADAANAQIGVAISAYYPDISLTGSGGFESGEPGQLDPGAIRAVVDRRLGSGDDLRCRAPPCCDRGGACELPGVGG